jgi:plastocyanin
VEINVRQTVKPKYPPEYHETLMNDLRYARKFIAIAGIAAVGVFFGTILGSQALTATATPQGSDTSQGSTELESPSWLFKVNNRYLDYENGVMKIRAGVGNHVAPLTWFFPQYVQIKAGETVTWYNPTGVGEPHTVTFVNNPASFAPIEAPFVVSNATEFVSADPAMNAEPLTMPGPNGTKVVIINNARSTLPVTMTGNNTEYLAINSNYTMTGNEDYVNSGWLWPDGQTPPGLPEIETFSVKFEEPGTYQYLCLIHPWMTGTVTVS